MIVRSEDQLDDLLSDPPKDVVDMLACLEGDLLLLGVAGKMGPTLAQMARRASEVAGTIRRVIGVSRFTEGGEHTLRERGIETIRCDLLDECQVARLPDAPLVICLAGKKFGSRGHEAETWALNSYLPAIVSKRFRTSRIVAFSTGNVYGLAPITSLGSQETDPLRPVGEYAMSCLGRERIFEYFCRSWGTPMALLRLNYACELRYGVLVDLAHRVWANEAVDLSMGYFNVLWQGDANAMALRALAHCATPPRIINLAGPERLSVRTVCEEFGRRMNRVPRFYGREAETALLNDARRGYQLVGRPSVDAEQLIAWVAEWVSHGGANLGKPTHFESRDGQF